MYAVHNAETYTELGNVEARMRDLTEAVDNLIERARGAAAPAPAPAAAPAPTNHFFVFAETENQQPVQDMENKLMLMEHDIEKMDEISFYDDKFQFIDNCISPYIEKIKAMASVYRGCNYVKVCITVRDEFRDSLENKIGFMTLDQYKKLCIFVISRSGSDDLLDPGLDPRRS
jgi:hypothetical protein